MRKLLLIFLCLLLFFISCRKENWKPENKIKGYIEYYDILHYGHANHTEVYLKTFSNNIVKQTLTTNSGKFEFNNIVNGEYYIYAYRESNLTSVKYDGYSEDFFVDGYTVKLDTITLNIILD